MRHDVPLSDNIVIGGIASDWEGKRESVGRIRLKAEFREALSPSVHLWPASLVLVGWVNHMEDVSNDWLGCVA